MPLKRGNLVGWAVALATATCLLTALVLPRPAHACSCAPPGSPAEALAEADAVFAGEVTLIRPLGHPPFRLSSADPVEVEFQLSRVWKGPRLETTVIETELSEISCGYEFKKGGTYIVYVHDGRAGSCTRTSPAWRAFQDLVALGPGSRPESVPTKSTGNGMVCGAAAGNGDQRMGVATVGLLAGVIALGIRRRPRL
ncbi:MAG: hypothetical protein OXF79_19460 [Chloroflexi bacterium]|nr:hypothetical protein [Chloroflexota bacterium]